RAGAVKLHFRKPKQRSLRAALRFPSFFRQLARAFLRQSSRLPSRLDPGGANQASKASFSRRRPFGPGPRLARDPARRARLGLQPVRPREYERIGWRRAFPWWSIRVRVRVALDEGWRSSTAGCAVWAFRTSSWRRVTRATLPCSPGKPVRAAATCWLSWAATVP